MADRFTYLPSIGLFLIVCWGVPQALRAHTAWFDRGRRLGPLALAAGAAVVLIVLAARARAQAASWRDNRSLWEHSVAVVPGYVSLFQLARQDLDDGRLAPAVAGFQQSLRFKPDDTDARVDLGIAYTRMGKLDEAAASYREALGLAPNLFAAHNNYGNVLTRQGRYREALDEFRRAAELEPGRAPAHLNLGLALARVAARDSALVELRAALALQPDLPGVRETIAALEDSARAGH